MRARWIVYDEAHVSPSWKFWKWMRSSIDMLKLISVVQSWPVSASEVGWQNKASNYLQDEIDKSLTDGQLEIIPSGQMIRVLGCLGCGSKVNLTFIDIYQQCREHCDVDYGCDRLNSLVREVAAASTEIYLPLNPSASQELSCVADLALELRRDALALRMQVEQSFAFFEFSDRPVEQTKIRIVSESGEPIFKADWSKSTVEHELARCKSFLEERSIDEFVAPAKSSKPKSL